MLFYYKRNLLLLSIIAIYLNIVCASVFAEDLTHYQINLKLIDRLARIEEGQKAILIEMRTRFKAVDERFDSMDKRLDSMDKRIDYFGNFNIAMIAALITLIGYIIWDRKTAFEKAFSNAQKEIEKLVNESFINNRSDKYQAKSSSIRIPEQENQQNDIQNIKEKLNQIINVMAQMSKQSPEMQKIMNAAQLA